MHKHNEKISVNLIRENTGSTLITVIVAIAFVTILTSIILGTSLVNVRMKGIDRRTKGDFYYAEKSLNDIYTGLGQELAVIAGSEYEKAFKKVGLVDEPSGDDYNLAETAEKSFRKEFVKAAYSTIDKLDSTVDNKVKKDNLEAYILASSGGEVLNDAVLQYQKKDGSTATADTAERVALKDVQVSVTDASGYRSVITTDVIITIPTVDFLGTNADVSDYGLIANKGLYITGGTSGCNINGNVYAGVHATKITGVDDTFIEDSDRFSRDNVYGGINIKDGKASFTSNYVISKGNINLSGTEPQIKVMTPSSEGDANLANFWYTSMRTIGDPVKASITEQTVLPIDDDDLTIDIDANTFALNDLALNADNTSVKIEGNYYGYNDKTLTNVLGAKSGREDGISSAIIVNGSNAYLDMRDINNFVLMGKAFIDFTTGEDTDGDTMEANPSTYKAQVVPTAESVALKTNQQLYLVPTDFLDGPNPAEDNNAVKINDASKDAIKGAGGRQPWFGLKYLNYGTDISNPNFDTIHKKYTVAVSGSLLPVYYDYLEFDEDKAWYSDGTFDYRPVGTGGSVSSKTRFFLDIMTSEKGYDDDWNNNKNGCRSTYTSKGDYIDHEESEKVQPSAYRLYKRIYNSMDYDYYFDLKQCVVGNTAPGHVDDAHYYAKNAVVNYQREGGTLDSNVLSNTDGMLRYSGYTEKLFKRYMLLCTLLDGKEDMLLEGDPAPERGISAAEWPEWTVDSTAPISHFIDTGSIDTMSISTSIGNAGSAGLKPGAYGVCIATDESINLSTLSTVPGALLSGTTFKGVAIVDGDITVPAGMTVDGLLMATGTITLMGNNTITYDKGLIQSRIEKEMNIIKNDSVSADWDDAIEDRDYMLIRYLTKSDGSHMYKVDPGSKVTRDRIEADYNDFMHYENWQKGEK